MDCHSLNREEAIVLLRGKIDTVLGVKIMKNPDSGYWRRFIKEKGHLYILITRKSISLTEKSFAFRPGLISLNIIAPVWVHIILGQSIQVSYCLMLKFLAICIFIPMIAAMLFRAYSKNMIYEKLKSSLKNLSIFGLMLMVFVVFVSNGKLITGGPSLIMRVALVAFSFISILIGGSIVFTKVARSSYNDSVALIISSSAKNTALAMGLTSSYFGNEASLVVAIAGSIVQLLYMLVFSKAAKHIIKQR
jgi:ACR3 family arsenite efflux pump ArsB